MTGASVEATLELWASSLRDVKARMRSRRSVWPRQRDSFWTACWVTKDARRDGCVRKRPAIPAPGGNRRSWAADAGMRKHCVTSCAITRLRRWPILMPL